MSCADDMTVDTFWGYMEGRGWAFLRDENYASLHHSVLPTSFDITAFRNDLYRSIGGYLRVYGVLKRGRTLEDRLFFRVSVGLFRLAS